MKADRHSSGPRAPGSPRCFPPPPATSPGAPLSDAPGGARGDGARGGSHPTWRQTVRAPGSEATHQREPDSGGERLPVAEGLDDDDGRRGHGLGQLVGADGVVLQGEVGEDHEAAEAERQEHEPRGRQALGGKDVELVADVEAEPGDHEVHEGQAHVGEAVVHVDPLVEEHDADGHQQVEQQPGSDAPVAAHPVGQRRHGRAAGAQPPRGAPGPAPALRRRAPAAARLSVRPGSGSRRRAHMLRRRPSPGRRGGTSRAPPLCGGHVTRGARASAPSWGAERPPPRAGALGSGCPGPSRLGWAGTVLLSAFPVSGIRKHPAGEAR